MPLQFDRAPLSIFKTVKNGTKLYLMTWKEIIIYGIFCGFISLVLKYCILQAVERLNAPNNTLAGFDLLFEFLCLLALSLVSIFLLLTVAYRIKTFVDKTTITVKQDCLNALSKIIPTFVSAMIITFVFGIMCGASATIFAFLISNITNWHAVGNQIWGTILIVVSILFYVWMLSLLIRTTLYALAILFDDKGVVGSIKYSMALIKGWRNVIGTAFLFIIIQAVTMLGTVELPALFELHPLIFDLFYFIMASLIFPWSVSCLVCWYWHLQKRGYLDN